MNYSKLKKNLCDVIKEQQVKLGYRREIIRLYYPLQSLNRLLDTEYNVNEMQIALQSFAASALEEFGQVLISHKKDRFCFYLPEEASQWIDENTPHAGFIYDFIDIISRHHISIEDILEQFHRYSGNVHLEKMSDQEFDYVIYFEDGQPDDYRYCLTEESGHFIYHRFSKEDYLDFLD